MNVYFVRHGQSESNLAKKCAGWAPVNLTELGRHQAFLAGSLLKGITFDKVYSSDLPRSVQTCMTALPSCSPILSNKLREVSVGSLSGRFVADVVAEVGKEVWHSYVIEQNYSAFGGETGLQVDERLASFAKEELEQLTDCENVAVFGHEGTIHSMMNYVLGKRITLDHVSITNASITKFTYRNGIWKLASFNFTGSLV